MAGPGRSVSSRGTRAQPSTWDPARARTVPATLGPGQLGEPSRAASRLPFSFPRVPAARAPRRRGCWLCWVIKTQICEAITHTRAHTHTHTHTLSPPPLPKGVSEEKAWGPRSLTLSPHLMPRSSFYCIPLNRITMLIKRVILLIVTRVFFFLITFLFPHSHPPHASFGPFF